MGVDRFYQGFLGVSKKKIEKIAVKRLQIYSRHIIVVCTFVLFFVCSLIVPVSTFTARKFSMWDFFSLILVQGIFGGFTSSLRDFGGDFNL